MPPVVVSLINLKGGVGKTTTTVQLAECLVSEFGKKVLVIDLDPQTNATIALIDEIRWEAVNNAKQTIAHLIQDLIDGTNHFDLAKAVLTGVSNLRLPNLSLLPSSIELINVQDRMSDISVRTTHTVGPMQVLKFAVEPILDRFDYVLIDCPPNLGFITQNGVEISDYYLIPTIPDALSTYGFPQIIGSIDKIAKKRRLKIRCLGMVVTKLNSRSTSHQRNMETLPDRFAKALQARGLPPARFFESRTSLSNAYAEALDYSIVPSTFLHKWGYSSADGKKLHEHVTDLTQEFMRYAVR